MMFYPKTLKVKLFYIIHIQKQLTNITLFIMRSNYNGLKIIYITEVLN